MASEAPSSRPLDVAALRAEFPILNQPVYQGTRLAYLDNAASSQRPLAVLRAMDDVYRRCYANVHRGSHWLSDQTTEMYEQARDSVREFLNARHSTEIVFTSGTTASINLVARSWGDEHVGPDDEILLTIAEHHSNIVPWQQLAARRGCRLRFAPLTPREAIDVDALESLLSPRTRLVAFTAASNVLGGLVPLRRIVAAAREHGALTLVDAAQVAPHERLDVQAIGADFLALSGHKMLGPNGIGVLYGKQEVLESMPPFLGGGGMIRTVATTGYTPARVPERFEAGTPPIVEAIGLSAAIAFLRDVGLTCISRHQEELVRSARAALREIPGVRVLGDPNCPQCGLVSFVVDQVHPQDLSHLLDRGGVAIRAGHHCAMPLHDALGLSASARASFQLYNDQDDIDQWMQAMLTSLKTLRR